MNKRIPVLSFVFLLCLFLKCKKESNDPRDKVSGLYKLAGTAHFVIQSTQVSVPNTEFDLPDSGTLRITKVGAADSAGWIRITGAGFDTRYFGILNFSDTGYAFDAQFTDSLITIPVFMPISGFGVNISGTATFTNGKLNVKYFSPYRFMSKTADITSY